MATRADVRPQIDQLLGNPVIFSDTELNAMIALAHTTILQEWVWPEQRGFVSLTTVADVAGTDAGLTSGSATVTTADSVSGWVGRQIRFAGDESYYTITAVDEGVDLTLDAVWAGADADPVAFTVFTLRYALPAAAEQVLSVQYRMRLDETTQEILAEIDPERWDVSAEPTAWAYAGRNASNAVLIELWERPQAPITLMIDYLKTAIIDDDTDVLIAPAHLVVYKAAALSALSLASKTTDDSGQWSQLSQQFEALYNTHSQTARLQATKRFSSARRVREGRARSGLVGTDFGVARNLRNL